MGYTPTRRQGWPFITAARFWKAAHLRDRSNFGAVADTPYARTPILAHADTVSFGAPLGQRPSLGQVKMAGR